MADRPIAFRGATTLLLGRPTELLGRPIAFGTRTDPVAVRSGDATTVGLRASRTKVDPLADDGAERPLCVTTEGDAPRRTFDTEPATLSGKYCDRLGVAWLGTDRVGACEYVRPDADGDGDAERRLTVGVDDEESRRTITGYRGELLPESVLLGTDRLGAVRVGADRVGDE